MAQNILPGIEVRQGGIYCALSVDIISSIC